VAEIGSDACLGGGPGGCALIGRGLRNPTFNAENALNTQRILGKKLCGLCVFCVVVFSVAFQARLGPKAVRFYTGVVSVAPFGAKIMASSLAGSVALALRDTSWVAPGCS
jgi:hypothetical protein